MRKPGTECDFEGCYEEVHARGLCPAHHAQWYRGVELAPVRPKTTPEDRFLRSFTRGDDTACWTWTGKIEGGRGRMRGVGRMVLAHVFSYEHFVGPIPEGLEIDHKCQVPLCVNPNHLRTVSRMVNAQNKRLSSKNSSGYKGVHWNRKLQKWSARVRQGQRSIYVGHSGDVHEAGKMALLGRIERYDAWNKYDAELAERFGVPYPFDPITGLRKVE